MKINSFHALGVHGYLNFEINFFSELTFLIGINGSGKTSALKLILGLTSPSYEYLSRIPYLECTVICSSNSDERDIIIKSKRDDEDNFVLSLLLNGETFSTSPIGKTQYDNNAPYEQDDISLHEARNREIFDSSEITRKVRELATPKYLGLDRRVYEGRFIDYRYRHSRSSKTIKRRNPELYPDSPAIDFSLDEVQSLVYDYIRKIAQQQPVISEEFKQRIFKQTFSFPEDVKFEEVPSLDQVSARKDAVLNAINNLGMGYLNSDITFYFKKIEELARLIHQKTDKTKKNKERTKNKLNVKADELDLEYYKILGKWYNNSSQLKRIDEIINYSQEYQEKIIALRSPIKRLEKIVTDFLTEGQKNLEIGLDGEIRVGLKNGKYANIYELSSGEKQIIIMIAHLIFEEDQKPSGIFIIDEPELSLHITWQEIFVDSIKEASPKTQFILATHAPTIISKVEREVFCQDLNTKNINAQL
jgi:predicted ATP-binding protein involved in virulence